MSDWTPGIGGGGGAFFFPQPGELTIEIEKRDLNKRNTQTELRAILFGPDRQVIQEERIPADDQSAGSGIGPAQTIHLSTNVQRPALYGLMVMVANDRYGENIIWCLRTNSARYLLETSRGHKDADHLEPIVLLDPDSEGNVCFLPRPDAFTIDISDIPNGVEEITLHGAADTPIATLKVSDGQASHTVESGDRGVSPWRLHFPSAHATVHIDGTTRWPGSDPYPNLSLWSPHRASWFPLHRYRWLLQPYNKTVYSQPGKENTLAFQLHNNSDREFTANLELEFPNNAWDVHLSDSQPTIAPYETATVTLNWTTPDQAATCHLYATAEGFSTYATLNAQVGEAPVSQPLDIPYAIKPFQHENEQFGYLPDYPVETQVYFNEQNQPFIRTIRGIVSWRNDQWTAAEYPQPVSQVISGAGTKVSFDADGDIYVLATSKGQHVLLYSADNGETFSSHPLPESPKASFDIEQFSGHNIPQGPPPIVRFTRTQSDPNHFWRRFGDQELLLPVKTENGIEWEDPVYLTDKSLGVSSHSGIPSNVVSRDNKIHIAWGEATDPDDASIPGVPAYVATYDRDTKELSGPYLIGYGAPPNDVHNTPCITMDSKGYLHVLTGTHGSPFHYSRSLKPNDASGGWTDPEPVGENLRQTYIGLVCDPNDTLHLCFRLWRHNTEYFPVSYFASLSHMSKRPNEPWSEPNVLTVAPFSEYSIYYHRLTINRTGHLFLSYDYWSTFWFYRTDHNARRRALMTSPDGGQTWKLAETNDLIH